MIQIDHLKVKYSIQYTVVPIHLHTPRNFSIGSHVKHFKIHWSMQIPAKYIGATVHSNKIQSINVQKL